MNGNMTGTVLNDAVGQATEAVNQMELLLSGTTYRELELGVIQGLDAGEGFHHAAHFQTIF